ncbi:hypothetical protein SDC9_205033 [bioreactor metagenome]|uniref:Uncharacterized protein n=1 Tax=bioreactor metagenome TaxID=1076179 RepID=A0A645J3R4_9ZZZZ
MVITMIMSTNTHMRTGIRTRMVTSMTIPTATRIHTLTPRNRLTVMKSMSTVAATPRSGR